MEAALTAAQEALLGGRPSLALALLSAASDVSTAAGKRGSASSSAELRRRQQQLQALCRIHLAGPSLESWAKLFGFASLQEAARDSAEVRRRYRQLAAAVHPDKCAVPGASQAFQKLQQGVQRLLKGTDSGGRTATYRSGEGEAADDRAAKRRRYSSDGAGPRSGEGTADQAGDTEGEWEEEWFDESWLASDNDGFAWWSEWDAPSSRSDLPDQQQQALQQGVQRQRQREAEQPLPEGSGNSAGARGGQKCNDQNGGQQGDSDPVSSPASAEGVAPPLGGTRGGATMAAAVVDPVVDPGAAAAAVVDPPAAAAAAAVPSAAAATREANESVQSEVDDVRQLANLDVEELRAEVQRRQNALFGGGGGGSDRGVKSGPRLTMPELNARLRRARGVLVGKLQQSAPSSTAPCEGGFL